MTQAPATAGGPVRVFVSYSHDSSDHLNRVLELSNRLRSQGVDCHIDQYEMSPPEGWPAWTTAQIEAAQFVLVICTETYARRVAGREVAGKGLGVRWEGAIISQTLYDAGGRNDKFIPVIFDPADAQHVPPFLRPVNRYDLSTPAGYENLYRHLTSQPRVIKPPLGAVQSLPPVETVPADRMEAVASASTPETTERVLIMSFGGAGTYVIPLHRADISNAITIVIAPAGAEQSAFLTTLCQDRDHRVGVAFGLVAVLGRVREARQEYTAAGDLWRITIVAEDTDYGAGFMEMSTSGFSADEIAELRARRILLNERRAGKGRNAVAFPNDNMLGVLISGLNTPLKVNASPLPELFATTGDDRDAFLRIARLLLVLYLRLSGTVEHVLRLDLAFESSDTLRVDFEGQRAKKYTNEPAPRISVRGTCVLRE